MNHNRCCARLLILLITLGLLASLLPGVALAEAVSWEEAYTLTGDYLEKQPLTLGADWVVIGLCQSERGTPEDYDQLLSEHIVNTCDANNRLHRSKATANARAIVTLTAMGRDATAVNGVDLVAGLNSMEFVKKQGLPGVVWTLLAIDCGNYPSSGDVTREALVQLILEVACKDGGWATSGTYPDPDMTGMTLQALAPYCSENAEVKAASERAVEALSIMQRADGGFATVGVSTSESSSQVIVALTTLGINPDTDQRFIKNGRSAVDALLEYFVEGGGFRHVLDGDRDSVATEQGYYALTAFWRYLSGRKPLYDMTEKVDKGGGSQAVSESPELLRQISAYWWLPVSALALGAAVTAAIFWKRRHRR